ncbi:MAG: tRNA (adenosine(37)-N6)-threonylcarbamoyltransferase complex ATPase subunit type 1 TsaE [Pseudomonadota bacterium]
MTELARLLLPNVETTCILAARLAPVLGRGDCLLLQGDIGAGKSAFARALIQTRMAAAGPVEDVPSPTYTLVQTYDAGPLEIWHADLYRLGDPQEAAELGLTEAFETALTLVEWPDRLGSLAPDGALWLEFAHADTPGARHLTLRGQAARWAMVTDLAAQLADA